MLTESEISVLMENPAVIDAAMLLKRDFIHIEAEFLEIRDDDFISLVLLAPSVGVALANGSISLFEELSLNKKARMLSRGSYFLKKDPVVAGLKFLINNFRRWEDRFLGLVKLIMQSTFNSCPPVIALLRSPESITQDPGRDLLNAPFIFIKFLSFLFLETEDSVLNQRSISEIEYNKILEISRKLGLDEFPVFAMFAKTFTVR